MIKLILTITMLVSANAFANETCSYLGDDVNPGIVASDKPEMKQMVERYILRGFDMFFKVRSTNRSSCESIPVDYSCTTSDNCESFCIASTVSEGGSHLNAIYALDRCGKTIKLIKRVGPN